MSYAYLGPCEISKTEFFLKIPKRFRMQQTFQLTKEKVKFSFFQNKCIQNIKESLYKG